MFSIIIFIFANLLIKLICFSHQWGQFLDHDITLTPTATPTSDIACCADTVTRDEPHPDVATGGVCNPIMLPDGDAYFG